MLAYNLTSLPRLQINWSGCALETVHLHQAGQDLLGQALRLQMSCHQQIQILLLLHNRRRIDSQH